MTKKERSPRSHALSPMAHSKLTEVQPADSDRFLHTFRTVPRDDRKKKSILERSMQLQQSDVSPGDAFPGDRKDLVRNGVGPPGDVVYGNERIPEQYDLVACRDARQVRDVYCYEVHAHGPDYRGERAPYGYLRTVGGPPHVPVRIAYGQGRYDRWALRNECAAVAHRSARGAVPHLYHDRLQLHHGPDRKPARAVRAVEHYSGADEVHVSLGKALNRRAVGRVDVAGSESPVPDQRPDAR